MNIIVEDGSGVTGANSYTTISGVGVYATNYGYTDWTDATTTVKEQSLMRAMRYMEGLSWKGVKYDQEQALEFPRSELYDKDERLVASDVVPTAVVEALCEACVLCLPDSDIVLQPNLTKDDFVNYEQVTGAVTVSYSVNGGSLINRSKIIESKLRGLVKSVFQITIKRG